MTEHEGAEHEGYRDWRSLEVAIKDAAKKAAQQAGPGVSAATVDAQIRQARFDRFLSRSLPRARNRSGCSRAA